MSISTQLQLIYEKMVLQRSGPKKVNREDISNFIFKITDGGRELFSVYTIRKTDSKTDPTKKAGASMKITGKYGSCAASRQASQTRVPELSTPNQYAKNAILTMCVTEVDGEDYISKHSPEKRTRRFDVTTVYKIEAGGEEYEIV